MSEVARTVYLIPQGNPAGCARAGKVGGRAFQSAVYDPASWASVCLGSWLGAQTPNPSPELLNQSSFSQDARGIRACGRPRWRLADLAQPQWGGERRVLLLEFQGLLGDSHTCKA